MYKNKYASLNCYDHDVYHIIRTWDGVRCINTEPENKIKYFDLLQMYWGSGSENDFSYWLDTECELKICDICKGFLRI